MTSRVFEQPLSAEAVAQLMEEIMTGRCPVEEVKAFLTTLAGRGETSEEIAAAVQVLRRHAVPLPLSRTHALCDTCGTGGDGQGTINVSTLAALVAASAGVRIAKHGNRAASSRCGSADLLEALGVNLDASPAQVARSIEDVGFGFCFAPKFHPAMKAVAPIRKELKIRTIFNLIGPLANPAPIAYQLVGVPDTRLLRPMAEALLRLGVRHGMVVRGRDGLDEVSTTAVTDVLEVAEGAITETSLDPQYLGVPCATIDQVRGGDVSQNARLARGILSGAPGAGRQIVALNAGCAIYLAGAAPTIREGIALAEAALTDGRTSALLERVIRVSQHSG
jgi:anthranilate phosphoribosyltransferase